MKKLNDTSPEAKPRRDYKILTDTIARTIAPGETGMPDRTVKGLWLYPTSRKKRGYWQLNYTSPVTKKSRELSLGVYPDVSIEKARGLAAEARKLIANGVDPKEVRDAQKQAIKLEVAIPTFETAARTYIEQKKEGWRNAKHAAQWTSTLETYVFSEIGKRTVDTLTPEDFRKVLDPIWLRKAETASRIKQRCAKIMQWCWAHGHVQTNVVSVVVELLPDATKARRPQHHPAMRWQDVPDFVKNVLRLNRTGSSRPLLEWLILTSARSGESRNLTWDQIDMENAIWNIPPDNTKMDRLHNVPLCRCPLIPGQLLTG